MEDGMGEPTLKGRRTGRAVGREGGQEGGRRPAYAAPASEASRCQ